MTKWQINGMDCHKMQSGKSNVVFRAQWICFAVDGDANAAVASSVSFGEPSESFTEYSDLTETQVLQWVWSSGVDKTVIEAQVMEQLEKQRDPPFVSPPLPWFGIDQTGKM